jgi:ricin-type beta-trefoil lectin protein
MVQQELYRSSVITIIGSVIRWTGTWRASRSGARRSTAALRWLGLTAIAFGLAACSIGAPDDAVAGGDASSAAATGEPVARVGSCRHPACLTGPALMASFELTVASVCAADPFCCDGAVGYWDQICVNEYIARSPSGTCPASFSLSTRLPVTECLDITGMSTAPGAPLDEWVCDGQPNQHFIFKDQGDCSYIVEAEHSGQCLSVAGASTVDGAPIIQWPCYGGAEQRFELVYAGSESYALKAGNSGDCINIPGGSVVPGTPLIQWPCNLASNELFHFGP